MATAGVVWLGSMGCAPGFASRPRVEPSQPTPSPEPEPEPRAAWLERALAWAPLTERPIASEHLGSPHLAEVRVSPSARDTYLELVVDSSFEPETWLVESLYLASTGQAGGTFAMERLPEGWRFWVLDPEGRVDTSADRSSCERCHASAPSSGVFGLPRESAPPEPR